MVSYSPLYGSLPVGPAFDMLIAALMRERGTIYPNPDNDGEDCPGMVIRTATPLAGRPVACLKCSASGEVGIISLGG